MVKAKIKMDPSGVKRILDVGGPSGNKKKTRPQKQTTSNFLKEKRITTSTVLPNTPKHKLRSPRNTVDDQSSLSSHSSSDELCRIWAQVPKTENAQTQIQSPDPTSTNPKQCSPSDPQKLTVTAEVHCSQGGTILTKAPQAVPTAKADSVSASAVPAPREDEEFTVQISRKKQKKLLGLNCGTLRSHTH
jgi:hypothetical protein